jgi:hypothetical protein
MASSVDLALNWRQQDVAKKSKIETEKTTNGSAGAEAKTNGSTPKPKRKKAAPKKKPLATKPADPKKVSSSASRPEPSDEEIRIRAYFIAERRIQLSLQGDSAHDWIEARRQLLEEARVKSS